MKTTLIIASLFVFAVAFAKDDDKPIDKLRPGYQKDPMNKALIKNKKTVSIKELQKKKEERDKKEEDKKQESENPGT